MTRCCACCKLPAPLVSVQYGSTDGVHVVFGLCGRCARVDLIERDENDQRKEPTISEKVALAQAIEAKEKKDAEDRMKAGGQPSGNISGGFGTLTPSRARGTPLRKYFLRVRHADALARAGNTAS